MKTSGSISLWRGLPPGRAVCLAGAPGCIAKLRLAHRPQIGGTLYRQAPLGAPTEGR